MGNFDKFIGKSGGKKKKKSAGGKKKKSFPKDAVRRQPVKARDKEEPVSEEIRLNRFMAQAGVCSRREADELIKSGKVRVNGKIVTEMGEKVHPRKDQVEYGGKRIYPKNFVYFLMNKPKNHITTTSDELGRRTVMDIIAKHTSERVYPVGRLDRNTTGLLLFTNDGELAKRLTHPSHEVRKLYHVSLDKPVSPEELELLKKGVELDDGFIKADKIDYVDGGGPDEVGVVIHSGRNRIVRRLFEHLGYEVLRLDRVGFGPLTKKNLPRGWVRELTKKEISFLKML